MRYFVYFLLIFCLANINCANNSHKNEKYYTLTDNDIRYYMIYLEDFANDIKRYREFMSNYPDSGFNYHLKLKVKGFLFDHMHKRFDSKIEKYDFFSKGIKKIILDSLSYGEIISLQKNNF